MVIGVGIDVASVERMRRALARHGERLAARVLTLDERARLGARAHDAEAVAGRFAAKEATFKAFAGRAGARWHDVEIVAGPRGAPTLALRGALSTLAASLGVRASHVSITHDAGVAAAVVVLESGAAPVGPLAPEKEAP